MNVVRIKPPALNLLAHHRHRTPPTCPRVRPMKALPCCRPMPCSPVQGHPPRSPRLPPTGCFSRSAVLGAPPLGPNAGSDSGRPPTLELRRPPPRGPTMKCAKAGVPLLGPSARLRQNLNSSIPEIVPRKQSVVTGAAPAGRSCSSPEQDNAWVAPPVNQPACRLPRARGGPLESCAAAGSAA